MSLHLIFLPMYRGSITLHGIQTASILLAAALQKRSCAASGFHFAVAMTSYCSQISLMFLPEIPDPNRKGQLRLDYVFENQEGVRCQLHLGNRSRDAISIFTQIA